LDYWQKLPERYPELYRKSGTTKAIFQQMGEKWGWYAHIHNLCKGDIRRIEDITKIPHNTVLLWLAFEADLATANNQTS
jgi:hypothetical protein